MGSPLQDKQWIHFTPNAAVPAHGVMGAGTDSATIVAGHIVVSTKQGPDKVLYVNGPCDIASGGKGRCTRADVPMTILYDTGDGTPAVGEMWGPESGDWKLHKDKPGFIIQEVGSGGRVIAIQGEWHQARWIEFTTTAAFTTSSASVGCDGVAYHDGYEPDTAITTVYNGSAASGLRIFEGADNDKGKAEYSPETGKYIIAYVEPAPVYVSLIKATASADFSGGSIPINTPSIMLGDVYESGSAPASVNNLMNFAGKSGDDVFAVYNQANDAWYGFIVKLSDDLLMTQVTVDGGTFKLQKRDRDVRGWFKNDETTVADIHTGTDCS